MDRIQRAIDEAKAAVEQLDGLDGSTVTKKDARKAWEKVFRHSFFDEPATATNSLAGLETKSALSTPALSLGALVGLSQEAKAERMQSAVDARISQGGGAKPWASRD
ncbi:MAG: hypothetical protein ACFCVA_10335 [Gammaproteobacteria bacterium]